MQGQQWPRAPGPPAPFPRVNNKCGCRGQHRHVRPPVPWNAAQPTSHTHSAGAWHNPQPATPPRTKGSGPAHRHPPQKSTIMRLLLSGPEPAWQSPLPCNVAQQLNKVPIGGSCQTRQPAIPPMQHGKIALKRPCTYAPCSQAVPRLHAAVGVLPSTSTRQESRNKARPLQHPHPHAKQQQQMQYVGQASLFVHGYQPQHCLSASFSNSRHASACVPCPPCSYNAHAAMQECVGCKYPPGLPSRTCHAAQNQ